MAGQEKRLTTEQESDFIYAIFLVVARAKPKKSVRGLTSNIFSWLSDVPEFLSPKVRLLLFTLIVAFILTLIMEFSNMQLFLGPHYFIRAILAIIIAAAIYLVLERISKRIRRN